MLFDRILGERLLALKLTVVACLLQSCVPRERDSAEQSTAARKSTGRLSPPKPLSPNGAKKPAVKVSSEALLRAPFVDQFNREQLGSNWNALYDGWTLEDGKLCVQGAKNHPIWLRRRLPRNARIEFEATSASQQGDIKVELWGDGRSAAGGVSYRDATGYLAVFGGWKNQFHVLARLNEHGTDRKEIKLKRESAEFITRTVIPHQVYRFRVERQDGKTVQWSVNDKKVLSFPDPKPLYGAGHEHFGFNDWQVSVCFDNLTVTPLPD